MTEANGVPESTTQEANNNNEATEQYDRSKPYFNDVVGQAIEQAMRDPNVQEAERSLTETSLEEINSSDLDGAAEEKVSYSQYMKDADPKAKALVKHFHADYTRKMQEMSQLKKEYNSLVNSLGNQDFAKKMKEQASQEVEYDPFNEESYEKATQKMLAEKMNELLEPFHKEMEVQKAEAEMNNFKSANPDWGDYKKEMYTLLTENVHMTPVQAYKLAKAETYETQLNKRQEELSQYQERAREVGLKVGGARRGRGGGIPDHVKKQGARAVYEYLERNK